MRDDRGVTVARVIGALLALVVCAWFVLGAVELSETDRATAILQRTGRWTPAEARQTAALLGDAGRLNPDRQIELLRAALHVREGDAPAARAIVWRVLAQEPQNIEAWAALAHVRALAPSVPPPR